MDSAHTWKQYYAAERTRLGQGWMRQQLGDAHALTVHPSGALVIPHTRLEVTGNQIATAVVSVLASRARRVLALGVLHGGRRSDAARLAQARNGHARALTELRRVHDESGVAAEEFSLDAFTAMLQFESIRRGRDIEIVRRYPLLVGDQPHTVPGFDELASMIDPDTLLVVTTDPIHHGHAYGTPVNDCRADDDPATVATARAAIEAQLELLSAQCFGEFQVLAAQQRSDFRDTGPMMAALLGPGFTSTIHELRLVDYSAALQAPRPSWVAGALISVEPAARAGGRCSMT